MSGITYFIMNASGTVVASGSTGTLTSYAYIPYYSLITSGTYTRYVQAIDKLGWTGISQTGTFNYIATVDAEPEAFSFTKITKAELSKIYQSDTITLTGVTPNVNILANVDNGIMYINGIPVGMT